MLLGTLYAIYLKALFLCNFYNHQYAYKYVLKVLSPSCHTLFLLRNDLLRNTCPIIFIVQNPSWNLSSFGTYPSAFIINVLLLAPEELLFVFLLYDQQLLIRLAVNYGLTVFLDFGACLHPSSYQSYINRTLGPMLLL